MGLFVYVKCADLVTIVREVLKDLYRCEADFALLGEEYM